MTPSTTSRTEELKGLEQMVREFEMITGINLAGWARRQIPTTEYAEIDWRVCQRCGIRQNGPHRTWFECIIAYRELCSIFEKRIERLKQKNTDRGGMKRSDNRFVVVNGERMCLSDAARELGMSVDALRRRIKRRIGEIGDAIDLRLIEIDKPYARAKGRGMETRT